jgi:non-ribosomal peptide synthetase component F
MMTLFCVILIVSMTISFFLFKPLILSRFLYLDAAIEQEMQMTAANMFWLDALHDCNLDQSLSLPFDRYRLSDEHRIGHGTSFSFAFGEDLSHHFLVYVLSNNIKLEHLALATYYAFLFKLTNGERDLCIGMNTNGRYKEELMSVIGMFINAIPLRCQLDPHWSFHQFIEHVGEIMTSSLEYSYFPLQRILAQHPNVSKQAFLDTSFEFRSHESDTTKNDAIIGDARLCAMPISVKISEDEIMSKFDFGLIIQHDLDINQLSCTINASLDLLDGKTVDKIAQRFHSMLEQLFICTDDGQMKKPIYGLSLILPYEQFLIQTMNNTQVLFPLVACIHHEFVYQVMKHPQKLAVELDEQSLTYSELLYYVQVLSLNLLDKQRVIVGEIVCQCVERSFSMVN